MAFIISNRDHFGSIREMIASDGSTISCRYSYDPYGRQTQVSGSISCDFGFTGHYYHATSGLFLSPTRAYDPNLGRWISRDVIGEYGGLNLYSYCAGDPVNNIDPSGCLTLQQWMQMALLVAKMFADSLTGGSPGNPPPPTQVPTVPGTYSPAKPQPQTPPKPGPQNKKGGGCPEDDPPSSPSPVPNPVPNPPFPIPNLTPAQQAAKAAAAAEEAKSLEAAAAAEEEVEGLTILLDVDEAIVAVGVIVK